MYQDTDPNRNTSGNCISAFILAATCLALVSNGPAAKKTIDADGGADYTNLNSLMEYIQNPENKIDTVLFTGGDQDVYTVSNYNPPSGIKLTFLSDSTNPGIYPILRFIQENAFYNLHNNNQIHYKRLIFEGPYGLSSGQNGNSLSFSNCLFRNNPDSNGAVILGSNQDKSITFTNCIFSGNAVALKINFWSDAPALNIINCTFDGNNTVFFTSLADDNAIKRISIKNTLFSNNRLIQKGSNLKARMTYILIDSACTPDYGAGCLSSNTPGYIITDKRHNPWDWELLPTSPAVDKGDKADEPGTDFGGYHRYSPPDIGAWEAEDYSQWSGPSVIYLNTTVTGANVAGNVDNFPVMVPLDSSGFSFAQAQNDGRDIRFADTTGAPLPYELEQWDNSVKKALIWVKVPRVIGNFKYQRILMYHGNDTVRSRSRGYAVFSSQKGFRGVYHLNENPNSDSGAIKDRSPFGNHGTVDGMSLPVRTGIAGQSLNLNGLAGITIPDDSSLDLTGSLTLSAWISPDGLQNSAGIVSKSSYGLLFNQTGKLRGELSIKGSGPIEGKTSLDSGWYHTAFIYDGDSMRLYLNGKPDSSRSQTGDLTTNSQDLGIGMAGFKGKMDEVRVSAAVRSPDWVKLSYENQKPAQTLVCVGSRCTNRPLELSIFGTIPNSQIIQARDGTGNLTIRFKAVDPENDSVKLSEFQYSVDSATTWQPLEDSSGALPADWGVRSYASGPDSSQAPVQTFHFMTKHPDVPALRTSENATVLLRFRGTSDTGADKSYDTVTSQYFKIDNKPPIITLDTPITSALRGGSDEALDTIKVTVNQKTYLASISTVDYRWEVQESALFELPVTVRAKDLFGNIMDTVFKAGSQIDKPLNPMGGDTVRVSPLAEIIMPKLDTPMVDAGLRAGPPVPPPTGFKPAGPAFEFRLKGGGLVIPGKPMILRLGLDITRIPPDSMKLVRAYEKRSDNLWYLLDTLPTDTSYIWFTIQTDTLRAYYIGIDTLAPSISYSDRIEKANPGDSIYPSRRAEDNIANAKVRLRLHPGGSAEDILIDRPFKNKREFWDTIPGNLVDRRGLWYTVEIDDGVSVVSAEKLDVSVTLPEQSRLGTFREGHYRMISFPLKVSDRSVGTLLKQLGTPDKKRWRLYTYEKGWREMNGNDTLHTARAYWLRTRGDSISIFVNSGNTTLPVSEPYKLLHLDEGWNCIANPFLFNIPVSRLKLDGEKPVTVYARKGDTSWVSMDSEDSLSPWQGYVFKNEPKSDTLFINSIDTTASKTSTAKRGAGQGHRIKVSVRNGPHGDGILEAGFGFQECTMGEDQRDLPKPPFIGGMLNAFFEISWSPGEPFLTDYRGKLGDGQRWRLGVLSKIGGATRLAVQGRAALPAGIGMALLDESRGRVMHLASGEASYPAESGKREMFDLLIGTESYLTKKTALFLRENLQFRLLQNRPNPVRQFTAIEYSLPWNEGASSRPVSLFIYNGKGRLVRRLIEGSRLPGWHKVTWRGLDQHGVALPAGVYLYRLESGKFQSVRRLLLLR